MEIPAKSDGDRPWVSESARVFKEPGARTAFKLSSVGLLIGKSASLSISLVWLQGAHWKVWSCWCCPHHLTHNTWLGHSRSPLWRSPSVVTDYKKCVWSYVCRCSNFLFPSPFMLPTLYVPIELSLRHPARLIMSWQMQQCLVTSVAWMFEGSFSKKPMEKAGVEVQDLLWACKVVQIAGVGKPSKISLCKASQGREFSGKGLSEFLLLCLVSLLCMYVSQSIAWFQFCMSLRKSFTYMHTCSCFYLLVFADAGRVDAEKESSKELWAIQQKVKENSKKGETREKYTWVYVGRLTKVSLRGAFEVCMKWQGVLFCWTREV